LAAKIVLVVSTGATDCLQSLVSEMTYYVSSWTLNPTHYSYYYLQAEVLLVKDIIATKISSF